MFHQVVFSRSKLPWVGCRTKPRVPRVMVISTLPASFSTPGVALLFNAAKCISFEGVSPDMGLMFSPSCPRTRAGKRGFASAEFYLCAARTPWLTLEAKWIFNLDGNIVLNSLWCFLFPFFSPWMHWHKFPLWNEKWITYSVSAVTAQTQKCSAELSSFKISLWMDSVVLYAT